MNPYIGLWIDNAKAFIITLQPGGEIVSETIESNIEPATKSTGGGRTKTPYGRGSVSVEKSQTKQQQQLKQFYDTIIKQISKADKIYLYGPGTAKKELNYEINKNEAMASKVRAMHASDKMTEPQMIAKVRNFYRLKR